MKINTTLIRQICLLWVLVLDHVFQVLFVCSERTIGTLVTVSCLENELAWGRHQVHLFCVLNTSNFGLFWSTSNVFCPINLCSYLNCGSVPGGRPLPSFVQKITFVSCGGCEGMLYVWLHFHENCCCKKTSLRGHLRSSSPPYYQPRTSLPP